MAKANFKLPDEFLLKVARLHNKTDEILPKVLERGGKVILNKAKSNLEAVIGKDTKIKSRSTGELVSALGITSARQDKNGNSNIKVGFSEPRSTSKSNAKLANIIEYGKHGQPAKPFLKPAISSRKKQCIEEMTQALDEELEKL